jgi:hypothetical protein
MIFIIDFNVRSTFNLWKCILDHHKQQLRYLYLMFYTAVFWKCCFKTFCQYFFTRKPWILTILAKNLFSALYSISLNGCSYNCALWRHQVSCSNTNTHEYSVYDNVAWKKPRNYNTVLLYLHLICIQMAVFRTLRTKIWPAWIFTLIIKQQNAFLHGSLQIEDFNWKHIRGQELICFYGFYLYYYKCCPVV